jgi:PAS domain S-box-containing protein
VKNVRLTSIRSLRAKLDEVEQTLEAIRSGEVDALVTTGTRGDRVFTLEGADHGYRILLEVMSEGVAKLTQHGTIAYCNARFAKILGLPLERTIGSDVHDLVPQDERERFEDLLATGARERSEGEFSLRSAGDASHVPVLLSVVPLTMHGAERHCLVMTDLTEQRRNTDAIAAERAAMHTRLLLADRMSSMGTLAAGVAHEINNPLAYVIASLDLMLTRLANLPDDAGEALREQAAWMRRQVERAKEGSSRVRVIVRDLKAFSRADDETVELADLRRVLDTSIALVSNDIRHRARLVREYGELPAVCVNEARIGQVFVNLLVNAAHAIPAGAADENEIRVSARSDAEGNAVVEVRDTGAGIAAENLARIFEPFFTTKAVGMGTGLGLALCHGIVSSLGGQITVESTPGIGSLFRVVIPGAPVVDRDTDVVVLAPSPDSRGRLLVVDDEEDLCEVLQEALAASTDVLTTTDAHRALEWIATGERFDMILCDMNMPKMTGVDFHSRLESVNREQADRVILMSGGYTRDMGEVGVPLPRPALEKPFDLEQVRALMRETMRRGPPPAQPTP